MQRKINFHQTTKIIRILRQILIQKKKKCNRVEAKQLNEIRISSNKTSFSISGAGFGSLEAVMNDRITIPALNELNSHETRRNRVPNPRYTHPEIEANASTRNSPQLTLILSTLLASEKSRVVVLVVVVVHRFRSPSFQSREWARFQRGLPLPRISFSSRRRRREDPVWKRATRTKATRRGVERRSGRPGATKARQARQIF